MILVFLLNTLASRKCPSSARRCCARISLAAVFIRISCIAWIQSSERWCLDQRLLQRLSLIWIRHRLHQDLFVWHTKICVVCKSETLRCLARHVLMILLLEKTNRWRFCSQRSLNVISFVFIYIYIHIYNIIIYVSMICFVICYHMWQLVPSHLDCAGDIVFSTLAARWSKA